MRINYRLTTTVILVVEIAVIILVIGIFGKTVSDTKNYVDACRNYGQHPVNDTFNGQVEIDDSVTIIKSGREVLDCSKIRGLIALYTLLIGFMIIGNIIGWLICLFHPRFYLKLSFVVVAIASLMISILLMVHFTDGLMDSGDKSSNIGIGVITMVMNLVLSVISSLLLCYGPAGGITGIGSPAPDEQKLDIKSSNN